MQTAPGRTITLSIIGLVAGLGLAASALAAEVPLTIDDVLALARSGEAANVRTIEVPGTSTVLATWDARSGSALVPRYAISLDGQYLARVAEPDYELGLRYARFDPLSTVPAVDPGLAVRDGNDLHLVQFVTQPLPVFERQIAERGGIVRHYVAQYAYLVEADSREIAAIAALPYVRWTGPFHPAYRLEEFLVANLDRAELLPSLTYNIMVLSAEQKAVVAARIESMGGRVRRADAGKLLVEAELTPAELRTVAGWNEVLFIDRWGPYEVDMDIAREIGGANFIETVAGFDGQGVRAEVFDAGFNLIHVDFQSRPLIQHGTVNTDSHGASTSGISFGDGTGNPAGRGMMPAAQGIVADYDFFGLSGANRYQGALQLLAPPYEAVYQTSSVGSPRTRTYDTISAEQDQMLFDVDIVFCQSQSNAGTQDSRPQAWAKNVVSGGGVYHRNTLGKSDDCWCNGASIGPASDGRIKPTLTHFYDLIFSPGCCANNSYTQFSGTSGATPIICGHFGLFYQMWADGIFGNTVMGEIGVFGNRSHASTARAMLINTADQYDWTVPGNTDLTRFRQGWGMPNVKTVYEMRNNVFVIDESRILAPLETATYEVTVAAGRPALKATMVYTDRPGNPAVQTQHRVNDLDLKVISPSGTIYYGNGGLATALWSAPNTAPDTKNTEENVFVQNPEAGVWTVEVRATEVIQDGHVETPEIDADFALVVTPVERESAGVEPADAGGRPQLRLAVLGMGAGVPAARMSFDLPVAGHVQLRVFDVSGRLVASVYEGQLAAGQHTLEWAGVDENGQDVSAGLYFAQVVAGEQTASAKVLVLP
jgi:hypothetical protein